MRVEILAVAEDEVRDAVRYYHSKRAGLGDMFAAEIGRVFELLRRLPEIGSPLTRHVRRHSLQKFPYHAIYRVEKDSITILAIAHDRRNPTYWTDRI